MFRVLQHMVPGTRIRLRIRRRVDETFQSHAADNRSRPEHIHSRIATIFDSMSPCYYSTKKMIFDRTAIDPPPPVYHQTYKLNKISYKSNDRQVFN